MTWAEAMGVSFVESSVDEVVAEIEIGDHHRQAFGLVHGGVYSGLIETVASMGAWLTARARGQSVVGVENHTSFVRKCEGGVIRAAARPITRGRQSQLWEATVTDSAGRVLAVGRVRLLCTASAHGG